MAKIVGVSPVAILNSIDEGVMDAVDHVKSVIRSSDTKTTEKLSAANALIKMKVTFFKIQKEQSFDKLEYELKQINLKKARIQLQELEKALSPNATDNEIRTYSRVFTPSMRAEGIDDGVAKEVI